MRQKLLTRFSLIFIISSMVFTACGSETAPIPNGPTVKLSFAWWGDNARHEATQRAIDRWNSLHPNITVEAIPSAWDGYHDKLFTEFAANVAPDIFQVDFIRFMEFAKSGLLLDINKYKSTLFSGIDVNLWPNFILNGKTYGVAGGLSGGAIEYNATKLQQMGITPPSDNETAETLLQRYRDATKDINGDGKKDIWGIFDPMDSDPQIYNSMILPFGVSVWTNNMQGCDFNNPKVISELKKNEIYRKEHIIAPPEISVMDGQSYMSIGAVAYCGISLSAYPSEVAKCKDKIGLVMPAPPWVGGKDLRAAGISIPLAIYSKTKHPDEAAQFLSWLLESPEAAEAMKGMQRGVYPSQTQRDAMRSKYSEVEKDIVRVAEKLSSLNKVESAQVPDGYNNLLDIFTQEKNRYLLDQIDLTTFMNNVQKAGSKVIGPNAEQ